MLAASGCGGSGALTEEECEARVEAYAQYIRDHRSCRVDEDCRLAVDDCAPAGRCGQFYVNQDASDEEMEALGAAVAECHPEPGLRGDLCEPPCLILRPEPICDRGECQPGG